MLLGNTLHSSLLSYSSQFTRKIILAGEDTCPPSQLHFPRKQNFPVSLSERSTPGHVEVGQSAPHRGMKLRLIGGHSCEGDRKGTPLP